MTKGLQRSLDRGAPSNQEIVRQVIKVKDKSLTTGNGAVSDGWATVDLGGLPEGNILFLGAIAYMTFTGPTSGDLIDAWTGVYGVGTSPSVDETALAGLFRNIVDDVVLSAATAEVSPRTRGPSLAADMSLILDNTDADLELNLNLFIDNASISGDVTLTVSGEIQLAYIVMLDD